MSKIKVTIVDALANRSQVANIADDVPVKTIIKKYVEILSLPKLDVAGHEIEYRFQHKSSGVLLDQHDTLASVNVKDGDVLRLIHEMIAG